MSNLMRSLIYWVCFDPWDAVRDCLLSGEIDMALQILDRNEINVNKRTGVNNQTLLIYAENGDRWWVGDSRNKRYRVVEKLLQLGADPHLGFTYENRYSDLNIVIMLSKARGQLDINLLKLIFRYHPYFFEEDKMIMNYLPSNVTSQDDKKLILYFFMQNGLPEKATKNICRRFTKIYYRLIPLVVSKKFPSNFIRNIFDTMSSKC